MKLTIDPIFKEEAVSLGYTFFSFENEAYSEKMWNDLLYPQIEEIEETDSLETIKENQFIKNTKGFYKKYGKDPARFRPSSDSLWRRIVQKKGLYQINSLVDLNNYFSLKYKLPVGSYDADKLNGAIYLSIGGEGETYQGIGKDAVNIANLLILKDDDGAFGSPTSDSVKAMISEETKTGLLVIYMFDLKEDEKNTIQVEIQEMLKKWLNNCKIKEQGIV